jgi:hypothetical protein
LVHCSSVWAAYTLRVEGVSSTLRNAALCILLHSLSVVCGDGPGSGHMGVGASATAWMGSWYYSTYIAEHSTACYD